VPNLSTPKALPSKTTAQEARRSPMPSAPPHEPRDLLATGCLRP